MRDTENRLARAVPYMVLVFAIIVASLGFYLSRAAADRAEIRLTQEQQTRILCEAQNNDNAMTLSILEYLAQPRSDDAPGDYERRQEQLAELSPRLQPVNCDAAPGLFE